MKITFHTLGCKANQFDSQALEHLFAKAGHEIAMPDEKADVYVVNTCTVTAMSDKKSRQLIRKIRRENPDAVLCVIGCYPQKSPEEVLMIEGIDIICGTSNQRSLLELAEKVYQERQSFNLVEKARGRTFEFLPAGELSGRTRALIKVQDGCDNFCSYCIIPYTRGNVRSLPIDTCVAEIVRLQKEGFLEVVLTGIEISSYGKDLTPRVSLTDLIEAICVAVPKIRIRLGSLEPSTIDEDFCTRLKGFPNLCPHFHLSLQSGCDATLKRMNRKYDTKLYAEVVSRLRRNFENCAITTDLIVGFPGETDGEFAQTMDFIKQCRFSAMHIFPYSKRPGTKAALLSEQVLKAVKEQRAKTASQAAAAMSSEYLRSQIGKTFSVLFEEAGASDVSEGHSPNYCLVRVSGGQELKGQIRNVMIDSAENDFLIGHVS